MSRPTDKELKIALEKAEELHVKSQDEFFLAKSLINHNYRLKLLEGVLYAAKHYLHSGEGAREHTELLMAIEEAEKSEAHPGDEPYL